MGVGVGVGRGPLFRGMVPPLYSGPGPLFRGVVPAYLYGVARPIIPLIARPLKTPLFEGVCQTTVILAPGASIPGPEQAVLDHFRTKIPCFRTQIP